MVLSKVTSIMFILLTCIITVTIIIIITITIIIITIIIIVSIIIRIVYCILQVRSGPQTPRMPAKSWVPRPTRVQGRRGGCHPRATSSVRSARSSCLPGSFL